MESEGLPVHRSKVAGPDRGPPLPVLLIERKLALAETRAARILFVFCGLILPILSFLPASIGGHWVNTPWQSGTLEVYAGLLLDWPTQVTFYPVLLYSSFAITVWCLDPKRYSDKFWVQLGIFAGIPWALAFCVLAYVNVLALLFMLFAGAAAFSVLWAILLGANHLNPWIYVASLVVIPLLAWSGAILWEFNQDPFFEALVSPLVLSAMIAPPMTFFAFLTVTIAIGYRGSRMTFSLAKLLGTTVYLAASFATWRLAIDRMLIEYSKLPIENPNCFICTAAAHGHSRWVGAERIESTNGTVFLANSQMRWLKAAEIVFSRSLPRTHRVIRKIYDWLGPKLARVVVARPALANICYAVFKPLEWGVRILFALVGIPGSSIDRIYR